MTFEELRNKDRVTEITRRNIIDDLNKAPISYFGRLYEIEFLLRLYDLDELPSNDPRFKTAREDIWQHRENNPGDWPDEWIFEDSRFDLLHCSDEAFLRFLCEMLHPIVRSDGQVVQQLAGLFNKHLAIDGWEIVARTQISGKPVFVARRRMMGASLVVGKMRTIAARLDADYVAQQITRMEAAIDSDPELAIGTSKELIETICKTILHECGRSFSTKTDLPQLMKLVRKELDLLPEDISDKAKGAETIKRLLSNLGTVAQGIAELRGMYGTGHGKNAKTRGLQSRHARLAVGAASTLAVFLFETYQERRDGTPSGMAKADKSSRVSRGHP